MFPRCWCCWRLPRQGMRRNLEKKSNVFWLWSNDLQINRPRVSFDHRSPLWNKSCSFAKTPLRGIKKKNKYCAIITRDYGWKSINFAIKKWHKFLTKTNHWTLTGYIKWKLFFPPFTQNTINLAQQLDCSSFHSEIIHLQPFPILILIFSGVPNQSRDRLKTRWVLLLSVLAKPKSNCC